MNKEINQTIRFDLQEALELLKDTTFIFLKIKLLNMDNELKDKVIDYFSAIFRKYYNSIITEIRILLLLKNNVVCFDDIEDILDNLCYLMENRYKDYTSFFAHYEDLIERNGFSNFNYKYTPKYEYIISDDALYYYKEKIKEK